MVENCRGSVGLYEARAEGFVIFLFRTLGTNLKYPLVVGSKMICLGRNKDLCSQRSKYKSYGALRGCDLGVRDCLQVYCGK